MTAAASSAALPGFRADGRSVIVALDHALASGQVAPLDRPAPLLERIEAGAPDGLILSAGIARLASAATPWWLTADYYATSIEPGAQGELEIHTLLWQAEQARAWGAAGLKCLLVFGTADPRSLRDNVAFVSRLVAGARALDLPVMVEATLWGSRIAPAQKDDPALVAHATRAAFELGADVIKIPLPAGGEGLADLTSALSVPLVVMGGPAGEPAALFESIERAVAAGIRGVALGRNVWQHPQPAAFVAALHAVVHGGASAAQALALLRDATAAPAAR
jgi:fructose-bisphosphate aldolase, class I